MPAPRILVIPATSDAGSLNARLAALVMKELTSADAEVTLISLADYPLPLIDAEPEMKLPLEQNALKLKRTIAAHQGVFIATHEINASFPASLKNTIEWIARTRERMDHSDNVFRGPVFALGAATRDALGGALALLALRQVLAVGCGALVMSEQISVAAADQAFDDMDNLKDVQRAEALRGLVRRMVELSWERVGA